MPTLSSATSGVTSSLVQVKKRWANWLFQWRGPESGTIVLVQRRIFILPSRHGVTYTFALLLMLAGSINYGLSLGFVLTFMLAGMGVNSMLYTFRNMAGLKITAGRVQPVFVGDEAQFALSIANPGRLDRYSVGVMQPGSTASYIDVPADQSVNVNVAVPARQRGMLMPGRLTLFTRYPLGLCYSWAYAEPDASCLVYPKPKPSGAPLPRHQAYTGKGIAAGAGHDDFSNLRSYHPGDPPRHIAWKAVARSDVMLTKQFTGRADSQLWLDWHDTPPALGIEGRLSRLTRWALDAYAQGLNYGLRLPGMEIPSADGAAQLERCLQALALYQHG